MSYNLLDYFRLLRQQVLSVIEYAPNDFPENVLVYYLVTERVELRIFQYTIVWQLRIFGFMRPWIARLLRIREEWDTTLTLSKSKVTYKERSILFRSEALRFVTKGPSNIGDFIITGISLVSTYSYGIFFLYFIL